MSVDFTVYHRGAELDATREMLHLLDSAGVPYIDADLNSPAMIDAGHNYANTPICFFKRDKVGAKGSVVDLVEFLRLNKSLTRVPLDALRAATASPTAKAPYRSKPMDPGAELYADLGIGENVTLYAGEVTIVTTGVAIAIPEGHYGRFAAIEGLARAGVLLLSQVVDSDDRTPVEIAMTAVAGPVRINHGDRVAQLIVEKCAITPVILGAL